MLLSDRDILSRINRGDIQIEPFNIDSLGSNSYDLHLSDTLKVYTDDVLDARERPGVEEIQIPEDGLVLEPDRLYLGSTLEWTKTESLVPRLEGKSSMARLGLSVVSDGGFGDVDFEGCWTLELSVKQPVRIYPHMPICQISYITTGPCDMPYSDKSTARYANYNEPVEYQPPGDDLPSDARQQTVRARSNGNGEESSTFRSLRIPIVQCEHASDLPLPRRATPGSSAVDLIAAVENPVKLKVEDVKLIDTGIKISLHEGWEAQVRARSSLAQRGIIVPNGPGTIDSDYRGEIKVLLHNLGSESYVIERGDRIAQLAVQRVQRFQWELTESLDETDRNTGGFGSTGRKSDQLNDEIPSNGNV